MALPANRHDALFKLLVSRPDRAGELLWRHLPVELVDRLDTGVNPEPVGESFIDGDGRSTQCDALFRVALKSGGEAGIYVLAEHKSSVDPLTPVQLLKYVCNIWSSGEMQRSGSARPLPLIIPVVLYHGEKTWTVPESITDMVDVPEELKEFAPKLGDYYLRYLGRGGAGEDSPIVWREPAVLAMALVRRQGIAQADVDDIAAGFDDEVYGKYLVEYVLRTLDVTAEQITAAMQLNATEKADEVMVTLADQWKAEGEAKGLAKGLAEGLAKGKAETLIRLLRRKFGTVPAARLEQIESAPLADLEFWTEAVLVAQTVDEVFDLANLD